MERSAQGYISAGTTGPLLVSIHGGILLGGTCLPRKRRGLIEGRGRALVGGATKPGTASEEAPAEVLKKRNAFAGAKGLPQVRAGFPPRSPPAVLGLPVAHPAVLGRGRVRVDALCSFFFKGSSRASRTQPWRLGEEVAVRLNRGVRGWELLGAKPRVLKNISFWCLSGALKLRPVVSRV